jgi:hypothetical protein
LKKILINLLFFLIILNFNFSIADEKINKLKDLLKAGLINETEFKQAIKLIEETSKSEISDIKVRQITGSVGNEKFEKYEFYIDNYRVHTLSPGFIRIDNLLTGETDVALGEKFKVKFSREGKKFFEFVFDKENLSSKLLYKDRMLINWSGKYVQRYSATFYQMQILGHIPFHFYITIPGKNPISLNMKLFNDKIDKAVAKVKEELAIKYNLTASDIDRIMKKKDNAISKEKEKIIKELTEKYAGKEITEAIREEIEKTIGEEMANAFISEIERVTGSQIDAAIEQEVAEAINEAIAEAVELGVSEATAAAAIAAMIYVYAMGGSDQDAMDACRSIAGDAC